MKPHKGFTTPSSLNNASIALEVKNFSKKYRGRKKFAVSDATFEVRPGEFHGFIGANGAGKTTTIKSLIGAYANYEGQIRIFGHKNVTRQGKKHLGYIPENANFPKTLSALEYITHMSEMAGLPYKDAREKAKTNLEKIGLANLMHKNPNNFSSGQKKQILLAQAIINNPDIIIMDEPAANLDPQARNDFFNTLTTLQKEGKAIFISSHILAELNSYVDSVTIIDKGKIIYTGKKDKLINSKPFVYQVKFEDEQEWNTFAKWLKTQKIKFQNNLNNQKQKRCYFLNQKNRDQALKFILAQKLNLLTFAQEEKTLQQAFEDIVDKQNKKGAK